MRENLINARKKEKLTQTEVAHKLGVSDRHYRTLEAGTSDGSVRVWQELSRLFGKTINHLLTNAKEPDGNPAES